MARLIATGIGLLLACTAAAAEPMAACPGASHRFETFALPAPSLERPKRVMVYLPPGYDCEVHRRYPTFTSTMVTTCLTGTRLPPSWIAKPWA